jgi:hypothetical protein
MFIFYIGVQFIINASYYSSGSLTSCHVLEYCYDLRHTASGWY